MATFNGERFLQEQIGSILAQLDPNDEVVVVDDASQDATVDVIEQIGDARVKVVRHADNRGYVPTFEEALSLARGQYIFLSDQDDIWTPGRVELMIAALQRAELVVGNCEHFGGELTPFLRLRLRSADSTLSANSAKKNRNTRFRFRYCNWLAAQRLRGGGKSVQTPS